jgi:membrane-associated protease RseP (regulator of RpoE activity)
VDLSQVLGGSWLMFVVGVLVMAVGIAVSIALHEVGHLIPAKLFNVRVTQYMIGFGKTLFSRRKGETEYGVKAVPLGGYISMIGMYPPDKDGRKITSDSTGLVQQMAAETRSMEAERLQPGDENRQFYQLPIWKRIVIMLGGPLMNLLIGVVCLSIVVLSFGTNEPTTKVESVNECIQKVQAGRDTQRTDCGPDDPAAPAHDAGVKPGDRIIRFADQDIESWDQLTRLIREHGDQEVPVVVDRDGRHVQLSMTPMITQRPVTNAAGVPETKADGTPKTEDVGFVGIGPEQELRDGTVGDIPPVIGQTFGQIGGVIIKLPVRVWDVGVALFTQKERPADSPMSVVGVGRVAGEVASTQDIPTSAKAGYIVSVLGTLNFSLFVFNLIPLLPLDGGHVAGALWEGIRRLWARLRRRADPGHFDPIRLLPLTYVVAVAFMGMSVLLIAADIFDPVKIF